MSVNPNDASVLGYHAGELTNLLDEFQTWTDGWKQRVDAVLVRIQNASESAEVEGGITGQVPDELANLNETRPELVSSQPGDSGVDIADDSSTKSTDFSSASDDEGNDEFPPPDTGSSY